MKLLALDTSSTSTGWALYEDGTFSRSGVVKAKGKVSEERMLNMTKQIYGLMDKIRPQAVVVETPAVARNAATQRLLSMIVGAVWGRCAYDDIFVDWMRPTEWRASVRNGAIPKERAALKDWSLKTVKEMGIEVESDDEADAILLGQAYLNKYEITNE